MFGSRYVDNSGRVVVVLSYGSVVVYHDGKRKRWAHRQTFDAKYKREAAQ